MWSVPHQSVSQRWMCSDCSVWILMFWAALQLLTLIFQCNIVVSLIWMHYFVSVLVQSSSLVTHLWSKQVRERICLFSVFHINWKTKTIESNYKCRMSGLFTLAVGSFDIFEHEEMTNAYNAAKSVAHTCNPTRLDKLCVWWLYFWRKSYVFILVLDTKFACGTAHYILIAAAVCAMCLKARWCVCVCVREFIMSIDVCIAMHDSMPIECENSIGQSLPVYAFLCLCSCVHWCAGHRHIFFFCNSFCRHRVLHMMVTQHILSWAVKERIQNTCWLLQVRHIWYFSLCVTSVHFVRRQQIDVRKKKTIISTLSRQNTV